MICLDYRWIELSTGAEAMAESVTGLTTENDTNEREQCKKVENWVVTS